MDAAEPLMARGIACAFDSYEVLRGDTWVPVEGGIPGKSDRIRVVDAAPIGAAALGARRS